MDFQVLTAVTAPEAEAHLAAHPDIVVVLSDQRMPDKTGVDFLQEVQQNYPLPVRILVTGYTDIESVIRAINQGNVFRYISKPWNEQEVRSALYEAHQFYNTYALLMQNNEELRKTNEELDQFAHNLTHDIRGPIVSAMGATDLLQESESLYEVREIAAMMRGALQKLENYVNDLNDYYLLRRGELVTTEVDFERLSADMERLYSVDALVNQVTFTTSVAQGHAFKSCLVPLRIIITNLLTNAFQNQRQEEQQRTVHLEMLVQNGVAVIKVTDNGTGIEQAYMEEIFRLFYRASHRLPGSGFGLYNVQTAAKRLNGRIEVISELDKGTTFTILIPTQ